MQTVIIGRSRLTRFLAKLLSIHYAAENVFFFAAALDFWKCVTTRGSALMEELHVFAIAEAIKKIKKERLFFLFSMHSVLITAYF